MFDLDCFLSDISDTLFTMTQKPSPWSEERHNSEYHRVTGLYELRSEREKVFNVMLPLPFINTLCASILLEMSKVPCEWWWCWT